jgi:F-type H+-transporting ATPase subunit delta
MAEKSTIARPYAKALFELAREHGQLPAWSALLEAATAVVTDGRVAKLLTSPHVTPAQLATLVAETAAAALGRQDLEVQERNFIRILAANRRLGFLPEIAARFARLRAEAENTVEVNVTSATPLNEAQQQQYAAALKQRLQREVRLHYSIDPALLGGAVLQADDLVIDGSLRGRLERLRTQVAN